MRLASPKGIIIRRLPPDSDLLEGLQAIARKEGIALGQISGIGALKTANVGIFLPDQARYDVKEFAGELEICHLSGNISFKDGFPFVHAHIVLSDREGRAWGGHVLPGCRVFVAEVILS
ncbi:MAG: DNA-binding protein, partial [Candidatus Aminicenantes bacterium]|nr:DNA-binding protein [Candidatus Aminicenantes bacterium]